MLTEFLTRLAIVLPLVCGLAVLTLVAVKRGWVRLPGFIGTASSPVIPGEAKGMPMIVRMVKPLTPTSRLAVVHFHGRDLLVGVSAQTMVVLASDSTLPEPAPRAGTNVRPKETVPCA